MTTHTKRPRGKGKAAEAVAAVKAAAPEAVKPKDALSPDERELVDAAMAVRDRAYAPYSRFYVGAAVRGQDGRIFVGCNVENASYGATICAERNAIAAAVAGGELRPVMVAVTATSHEPCPPCGMCRQVLAEFGEDLPILLVSDEGEVLRQRLSALLPLQFHTRMLPPAEG
jgi:cytidine deaminase